MAKKKNKKQHKPVSAATASDTSDKKRLKKARRWAREYTKKVRSSRPDDPRFQDGLDYDEKYRNLPDIGVLSRRIYAPEE